MKDRKIGKFYLTHELVYSEKIASVLSKMHFIPLRVEHLAYRDEFEYIGISSIFKKVPFGQMIPTYTITVNDLGKEISVSAQII